jgi:hypothetical protein
MPLLDHFHPPLSAQRHWESFHGRWIAALADALNLGGLPAGYFAEMQVTIGGRLEVDVASMEGQANGAGPSPGAASPSAGGVATAVAPAWAPPRPSLVLPAVFPDELEVLVFSGEGGPTLVGAIELVSPRNKDRPEARRTFAAKCAAYLQQGIGLVVVDVVTSRRANLHDEVVDLMRHPEQLRFPGQPDLYAAAYRPVRRAAGDQIDVWPVPLALGQPLPALPLYLRGVDAPVRVDLEASYTEARQRSRLD